MLIVLNLAVILLLLIMMMIWATYGFFSAFIHLIIVIGAGVLAFALWEPVTYMLLGTKFVTYAHALGLLIPFALLVVVLRVVFDKFCKANVHMPRIADQIGGAVCGLFSGVLAFGLLLNGINFLPLDREVFGWVPYTVKGNQINENVDGGNLWGFVRVNEWSAGFFSMVSAGSMSPTGGTPLAEGRPDLAKRAILTRLIPDGNQMRSAAPSSVNVTGVYAIPATEEAVYGLAQRSAILAFLKPSYELPKDIEQDEAGLAIRDAVLADLDSRYEDPEANGRPSDMLNIEAILKVSRTPQFSFPSAASQENFPAFVQNVANKMGEDLVDRLESVLGENKILYVVDTRWKKEAGTYNTQDEKLRVAISQIGLQVGDEVLAPIGYSIEYSQNTGGRVFTEIVSDAAGVSESEGAYASGAELSLGWVFPMAQTDTPKHFFVRELRFDLTELDKLEQNIGAVAQVVGAPLLPSPEDVTDKPENPTTAGGVKIAGTNIFADVSEKLPGSFAAAASSMDLDKSGDPWVLKGGSADKVIPGRGGKKSSVSSIWVPSTDRMVRLKLDGDKAKSLYGRALGLAESLNVMRIKDEGGNFYDASGYVLLRADRSMEVNIRSDARNGGLSANELPDVRAGETLMVYFQVPLGKKISAYSLGNKDMPFEELLAVEKSQR